MPIVSQAQNAAMHAAAEGRSTLGIPAKVARDFIAAGPASAHLPKRKSHHATKTTRSGPKKLGDEFGE